MRVDGRISALIELGAGFHPEISGRENVFINGIMLGLTQARDRSAASTRSSSSPSCSEFIDAPVKTYSSGMYMRLGFAVAIHVDPDVLLVDEVLAVGDEGFTHKCLDKFARVQAPRQDDPARDALARPGRAVLRRGAVARRGPDAMAQGDPKRVVDAYLTDGREERRTQLLATTTAQGGRPRWRRAPSGAGRPAMPRPQPSSDRTCSRPPKAAGDRARSRSPSVDAARRETASRRSSFTPASRCRIRLTVRAHAAGRPISCSASASSTPTASAATAPTRYIEEMDPQQLEGEAEVTFAIDSLDLVEGTYKLDVAVHKRDGYPVRLPPAALHVPREVAHARTSASTGRGTGGRSRRGIRFKETRLRRRCRSSNATRPAALADAAARARRRKVVFTNGVFDLLHPGHVRYLQQARGARRRADRRRQLRPVGAREQGDRPARSTRKPSAPRSSPRWHASTPSSCSTRRRRTSSSPRSSPTCSSRAPTGPKTPSSAATSSRRAAAAWSASRSSPGYSTTARSSRRFDSGRPRRTSAQVAA